uniref:Major facilitator superfamily (MFS) profile domain-containing protein n=1 Tax=Ascaris lumbricoides TaxID=6252 RepID=A0A9J2PBH8_ASCLU
MFRTTPFECVIKFELLQADSECKCGKAQLSVNCAIMGSYDNAPCACVVSAPDGGYGWVVVFAAFMSNFIVDGICNSFGTFMAVYQQHFEQSKAVISLIGSLLIGCYLLIGPLAGGLVNKYGVRPVVIAGSLLAAISFAASIFSPNAYVFMLSYGVFGVVSMHWPLTSAFGWRMTVCLLATIAISGVALGALFKPLAYERSKEKAMKGPRKSTSQEVCQHLHTASGLDMNNVFVHEKRNLSILSFTNEEAESNGLADSPSCRYPNESRQLQYFHPPVYMSRSYESGMTFNRNTSECNRDPVRRYAHSMDFLPRYARSFAEAHSSVPPSEMIESVATTKLFSRQGKLYHGSIRSLREFEERGSFLFLVKGSVLTVDYSAQPESQQIFEKAISAAMTLLHTARARNVKKFFSKYKRIGASVRNRVNEMVDVELIKEPVMMVMCISNVLAMLGFYVPFMFIIDMAAEKGIATADASLLLSAIGITNTLGRVFSGWVADRQWVSALTIHNMSLIICGFVTCFCPLLPYYNPLLAYAILFGFVISAYICLTSIVLTDLLGLDRLTNSFGMVIVSRGIASLLGTPIAGAVYDMTSSYNASFYFAGILMALAGIVPCAIPYLHRQREHERDDDRPGCRMLAKRRTLEVIQSCGFICSNSASNRCRQIGFVVEGVTK